MTSNRPSVLIAVCRGEQGRHTLFDEYLAQLKRPPRSLFAQFRGPSIAQNRNMAVQAALDANAEYLFFLDDDHTFRTTLLLELLARDREIVSGTYLYRAWPWNVCAFDSWLAPEEGHMPKALPLVLRDGMGGLQRVVATGAGALLIRTEVFTRIPQPWFELVYNSLDQIAEDFSFFYKVAQVEIPVYVDLEATLGHINTLPMWPVRTGDKWYTVLASQGEGVPIPPAVQLVEERDARVLEARREPVGITAPDGRTVVA